MYRITKHMHYGTCVIRVGHVRGLSQGGVPAEVPSLYEWFYSLGLPEPNPASTGKQG